MVRALLYEQKAYEVIWERRAVLLLWKLYMQVGHHVFKNVHSTCCSNRLQPGVREYILWGMQIEKNII
jgi:hypothetical protein